MHERVRGTGMNGRNGETYKARTSRTTTELATLCTFDLTFSSTRARNAAGCGMSIVRCKWSEKGTYDHAGLVGPPAAFPRASSGGRRSPAWVASARRGRQMGTGDAPHRRLVDLADGRDPALHGDVRGTGRRYVEREHRRGDAAAAVVAEHDNVLYLQRFHRERQNGVAGIPKKKCMRE